MGLRHTFLSPFLVYTCLRNTTFCKIKEICVAEEKEMRDIQLLAKWIKESNHAVVLTGAGMSTESGIPDFRSKQGWWKKIDPTTVSSIEAFLNQYELFHEFYSMRMKDIENFTPHQGHYILSKWEEKGYINSLVTQNVDGFHKQAGSKQVYELHGALRKVYCSDCGHSSTNKAFIEMKPCQNCEGKLRPDIVLFGEMLPLDQWEPAIESIQKADLVLVIGTSLQVYPVNELPFMTSGKKVLINAELPDIHHSFDLFIEGKAKQVLEQVDEIIKN